jgi:hypothetical protein
MKRSISLLSVLAFVLAFSGSVFGQQTKNVTASAQILSDITLTKNNDLNFGQIPNSQTTPATVDPNGATQYENTGANAQYGEVLVESDPEVSLSISFNSLSELSEANGTGTISFTPEYDGNPGDDAVNASDDLNSGGDVTTGTDGNYYIYLGGTLAGGDINSANGGLYEGTIEVTVAYL